jgi:hypothetical protein
MGQLAWGRAEGRGDEVAARDADGLDQRSFRLIRDQCRAVVLFEIGAFLAADGEAEIAEEFLGVDGVVVADVMMSSVTGTASC